MVVNSQGKPVPSSATFDRDLRASVEEAHKDFPRLSREENLRQKEQEDEDAGRAALGWPEGDEEEVGHDD